MMTSKSLKWGALLLLLCTAAHATTLEEVMDLMAAADKKANTFQFEFKQEILYTLTNEKQTNIGEAAFLKPDAVYLKQSKPLEQIIIANGRKVWIYTPAYQQAIEDDWKKWANSSMVPASLVNFGKGWADLKKNYTFSYLGTENGSYILSLTPSEKKARESFELMVWIDAGSGLPVKISLKGENVAITTELFNEKMNPALDKSMFIFKAPAGVEVLKIH